MAFPWIFGLGFGITFGAIFAKIHRIRAIVNNSSRFRRKLVKERHVMHVIVIALVIECTIILVWHLFDPLQWQREVIELSGDGLPVKSAGYCTSENAFVFWLIFITFNVLMLIYALVLCYITRNYPSEFAESRWFTVCVISHFQISVLAVPILVIMNDENNSIYFFVLASIVFLMSISVTLFIFIPKIYRVHFDPDRANNDVGKASSSSMLPTKLSSVTGIKRYSGDLDIQPEEVYPQNCQVPQE